MLDHFLEVAYEQEKQASIQQQVVDNLKQLPNEELHKIVSGETKLAYHDPEGGCWLDQFKESPLYEQALALETESLELDVRQQQEDRARRAQEREGRDAVWEQKDALKVQKRMLELDMRKQEAGMGGEGGEPAEQEVEEEAPEETPVDAAAEAVEAQESLPEEKAASIIDQMAVVRGAELILSMRKEARDWTPALSGAGLGAMAAPSMLVMGGLDPNLTLGQGAAASGGAMAGGALGGQAAHEIAQRLPVSDRMKALAPMGGLLGGSILGAGLGSYLARNKSKDKKPSKKDPKAGDQKQASVMAPFDAWGREMAKQAANEEMEKESIMLAAGANALKAGIKGLAGKLAPTGAKMLSAGKGAGSFLGQAGKGMSAAVKGGDMAQVGQSAKNIAGLGARKAMAQGGEMAEQAAKWVGKNPKMALGAGAGLAGGAYIRGRRSGQQSAQQG